jgi:hypothetical protein
MKKIVLLVVVSFLLFACAQTKSAVEIIDRYPGQIIKVGDNAACQKQAVESVLKVEYSMWKTTFSGKCYPDPACREAFHECLKGKGYIEVPIEPGK